MEYSETIPIKIKKNADFDLDLCLIGMGSEPQIVFEQTMLAFDSILPFSLGTVAEVTVMNPAPYPVEFYSLEFDKDYLMEEEVRRVEFYSKLLFEALGLLYSDS